MVTIIINTFSARLKTSNESRSISEIKVPEGFTVSHGEDCMWPMHQFWANASVLG